MHFLNSSSMPFFRRESFLSNEVEVLQTDVMRFFAILCLCLMAIFALVKTLPMAPPTGRPAIVEPPDLKAEAEALQKYTAKLKEKLAEMRAQVQVAALDAEKSSTAAAMAEKKEQEVLKRLNRARQDLGGVSRSLEETRSALKLREMKLAEIMRDLDNKQRIRSALQSQIENETQHLAKIRASLEQAAQDLNRQLPPEPSSEKIKPAEISPPQPDKTEFTLRFASDAALQQMISRAKVNFYAIAGKNAWQLKLKDGRPVYLSTEFPRQIYEMQTATVPVEYTAGFKQQVAVFGRSAVTWGVTLPSQTKAGINRIMEGRKGGDLVITADGEVVLK
jgi:hypothetical protein